jgi:DNA-binding MarR family transcriptional regulator
MPSRRGASQDFELATFLPHKLSTVSRLTQALLASVLRQSGLTIAQWRVYVCLASKGPMHLNGIADFTQLPQSSLSRSIAQMAERGLVENGRHENDRRISCIELTEMGRREFQRLAVSMDAACAEVFQMSGSEREAFMRTLDQLIARLSGAAADEAVADGA